jgi:co-chaperonin GroES (HSP10)
MGKTAIDIDQLARQAQRDQVKVDYLKEKLPLRPIGWQILLEPQEPKKTSAGGIIIADAAQQVEEITITVGRVLRVGPTALQGKTSSGVNLADLDPSIQKVDDLIGMYVIYQRYTGSTITLRRTGKKLLLLTVTELLAIAEDPDELLFYV